VLLIATTVVIVAIGGAIPYTTIGRTLGFVLLPPLYWASVVAMMLGYAVLAHFVKMFFASDAEECNSQRASKDCVE
jgi:Mg2+-importing ATPase